MEGARPGIWEVRGPKRHFTHSKVMAWVAFDRAIKSGEGFGLHGPLEHWPGVRDEIHAEVCARGYDRDLQTFTQSYGATELDASLLLISLVGFLPASDPRIATTVQAIERELLVDGLVRQYRTDVAATVDGLQPGEGVFLPCSFWLADVYVQLDRRDEARILFERLLRLRNDVGSPRSTNRAASVYWEIFPKVLPSLSGQHSLQPDGPPGAPRQPSRRDTQRDELGLRSLKCLRSTKMGPMEAFRTLQLGPDSVMLVLGIRPVPMMSVAEIERVGARLVAEIRQQNPPIERVVYELG